MGKITGFLDIERQDSLEEKPLKRIKNFNEFHKRLSIKQQQAQGARCMDCGIPFCQSGQIISGMTTGCPLNNLIPEWNDLVFKGNYKQALSRLLKTNNFPEFTSRVCPNPCEYACTCALNGDGVAIRDNELSIIEFAFENGYMAPKPAKVKTGKKIAVIGSGPAGLAAADQLNKRGHEVTVYERDDRLGGLLMYGIPNMKLEKEIIERRITIMKEEGVHFIINTEINSKTQAERLKMQYDSIVLACGARKPRDIIVEGRDAKNVLFAVDFLTDVTKSLLNSNLKDSNFTAIKDKKVLVIGGGDTGNDCVGTSIRLGCESVTQLEIMDEPPLERLESNPWPEWPMIKKTDYGQVESIAVFGSDPRMFNTTVKSFVVNDKNEVIGADLVTVKNVLNKKTGRYELKEVEGSIKRVDCDVVLIAAGFVGTESSIIEAFDVEVDARNNVKGENNYETNQEKVFVAGDMRRGQSLVVWAIREGREAAKAVDTKLMGFSNL